MNKLIISLSLLTFINFQSIFGMESSASNDGNQEPSELPKKTLKVPFVPIKVPTRKTTEESTKTVKDKPAGPAKYKFEPMPETIDITYLVPTYDIEGKVEWIPYIHRTTKDSEGNIIKEENMPKYSGGTVKEEKRPKYLDI